VLHPRPARSEGRSAGSVAIRVGLTTKAR
jgi:hypothetical protein